MVLWRWEVKRVGLTGSKFCGWTLRVWRGTRLWQTAVYGNPDDAAHTGRQLCRVMVRRASRNGGSDNG